MKNHFRSVFAVGALLITLVGCDDATIPGAPSLTPPPLPLPSPAPLPVPYVDDGFPPAPADASVYGRTSRSQFPGRHRYVLARDGSFRLQFLRETGEFFELFGKYEQTPSGIRLLFDANTPTWEADATIDSERLDVRYNTMMRLDDFEDGVYTRVR